MTLKVWFDDDACASLLTVGVAALGAAVANGTPDVSYCRGLVDALRASCVAFRVPWRPFLADLCALLATRGALDALQAADSTLLTPGARG